MSALGRSGSMGAGAGRGRGVPGYRRQIKVQANHQDGRHALARKIFHGRAGQLHQRYQNGMEDQIGALGLVLNALVLINTRYMGAAVAQPRKDGFEIRDKDVARLSPFVRHHNNVLGRYSFQLSEPPDGLLPLHDKHATDDEWPRGRSGKAAPGLLRVRLVDQHGRHREQGRLGVL